MARLAWRRSLSPPNVTIMGEREIELVRTFSSDHASSPGPFRHAPKGRRFDAHTISIWAHNMVQRGGSAQEALRMLLGRLQRGRLPHTTPLYNTALNICGHRGMLLEAGRILHQMVARNVRSDERTISSLLNAIAEYCGQLRKASGSGSGPGPGPGPGEGEGSRVEAGSMLESGSRSGTETGTSTLMSRASPPTGPSLGNSQFPSLEAFKVQSPNEAVELAIRLYTSWIRYTSDCTPAPFNNLLKVVAVTGRRDLLPLLFPLDRTEGSANWVPRRPDQITYTIAISAAGDDFHLARSYWDTFLGGCQHHGQEGGGRLRVTTHMLKAITWSLLLHVTKGSAIKGRACEERNFLIRLLDLVTESEASTSMKKRSGSQAQSLLTPDISSNIMHLCARLRMASHGLDFWEGTLFPLLQRHGSFRKSASTFDQRTIVALCELYIEVKDEPGQALALVQQLQEQFEMGLTDPDLLTVLLLAYRRLGDANGAERLFRQHCRRVPLDHRMIQQLLTAILDDGRVDKAERRTRLATWLRWLREADAKVYNRTASIPRLQLILKSLQ